jgi:hypothetical protein
VQIFAVLVLSLIGAGIWISDIPYPYAPAWIIRLLNADEWGYLGALLPLLGVAALFLIIPAFFKKQSERVAFFSSKLWISLLLCYFIFCGLWDINLLTHRLAMKSGFQGPLFYDLTKLAWLVLIQIGFYFATKIFLIWTN